VEHLRHARACDMVPWQRAQSTNQAAIPCDVAPRHYVKRPVGATSHPPAVLSQAPFRAGRELVKIGVAQSWPRPCANASGGDGLAWKSGFTSRAGCRRPVLAGRDTTAAGKKLPSAERRARALSKRPDASSEA
jgi:hypothetical protein